MTLEGSLDTFGMTDVLSLLAMTHKTGDLRVRRSESGDVVSGYVRLRDGVVVAASSDDSQQALARQLIVSGLIPDEVLASVSVSAGDALAPDLAAAAGLTADAVSSLGHEQVLNAVFELLRWQDGSFTFEIGSHAPASTDTSITVDAAVAEGTSRLGAWPALMTQIPDPSSVLAVGVTVPAEVALTPPEWGVLGLFDGHRTIAEALLLSSSGQWESMSLLAGLLTRGLLVLVESPASAAHRAEMLHRIGLSAAAASVLPPPPEALDLGSLTSLAAAASALEPAVADDRVTPGDGVDEALLQHLIAGVRAL